MINITFKIQISTLSWKIHGGTANEFNGKCFLQITSYTGNQPQNNWSFKLLYEVQASSNSNIRNIHKSMALKIAKACQSTSKGKYGSSDSWEFMVMYRIILNQPLLHILSFTYA